MDQPAEHRRPPLKAPPADQLRLLDVQACDTRLAQLAHRRTGLPELAELERVEARLRHVRDQLVTAQTERSDLERGRAKAEADVAQVRARRDRDQRRLDAGQVGSPRELQSLQSEIVSLQRRQSELEDVELEIMERLEAVEARIAELRSARETLERERAALVERRDATFAEIDGEAGLARTAREKAASEIDADLLGLYEKVRAQQGGVGAAEIRQRRCQGCRLELTTVDLGRLRVAAPDEVLRCEECRRILVRTPDSGL